MTKEDHEYMVRLGHKRAGVYYGSLLPEDCINILDVSNEKVIFIDASGKQHNVKLYKDSKNGISYIKFNNGYFYIKLFHSLLKPIIYKAYKRVEDKLIDVSDTNNIIVLSKELGKHKAGTTANYNGFI